MPESDDKRKGQRRSGDDRREGGPRGKAPGRRTGAERRTRRKAAEPAAKPAPKPAAAKAAPKPGRRAKVAPEEQLAPVVGLAAGRGVWVVLPTYDERENLEPMTAAILRALPEADLLIVDDNSPDGTGVLADTLAAREPRITVMHRSEKEGLGIAYRDAFKWVLDKLETRAVVQMDCDFSHDPNDLPRLLTPLMNEADLALGTRYIKGGGTVGWPLHRRLVSRAGTLFARTVLLLPYRDLTGGFKAWRRELIDGIRLRESSTSGYGFQVETTWWAHRHGARIVQVPIMFRERAAGRSKMTGGIIFEALGLVLGLRWRAMVDAVRRR